MIKFMATSDQGRKMLGIVVSEGNLRYLKSGMPIHFNAEEMGLKDIRVNDIVVAYCKDEGKFLDMATQEGLIGRMTKLTIIPKQEPQ